MTATRGAPIRAALLAAFVLAQACTSATFVPQTVRHAEVGGTRARVERARLSSSGRLWVSARLDGAPGARVHDARLVAAREPACARVGTLATAGELRQGGAARWERPLTLASGGTLEAAFHDYDRAFESQSVLELDLESEAGPSCLRLPLSGPGDALAWQPASPAPSLGLRLYADREAAAVMARAGVLTRASRHAIEVGIGSGDGDDLLGRGALLAFGLSSERTLWTARPNGLLSVSAELAYQARLAFAGAAPGRPRLIHGPRLGLRPLLTAWSPRLLAIGPRFGSFSFAELFFAFWLSPDNERSATAGFAWTWDSALPH